MEKMVCIKAHGVYLTLNELYNIEPFEIPKSNEFTYKVYVNSVGIHDYLTFSRSFVKEHLISIAEWRDNQINEILE